MVNRLRGGVNELHYKVNLGIGRSPTALKRKLFAQKHFHG